RAVTLLERALGESLTREETLVTYQTLASCHIAGDDRPAATADFEHLLRVDPLFDLDRTVSPLLRAAFEEARARIATGSAGDGRDPAGDASRVLHPSLSPSPPREGLPL